MANPQLAAFPTDSVAQIASRYSIPPAILQAVLRQGDVGAGPTVAGIPIQQLDTMGIDHTLQREPSVVAEAAAARLSQAFQATGDWQQALSQYLTGNRGDYLSPTSAVPGVVWSILGAAASSPMTGMDGYTPANPQSFLTGAGAFSNVLQEVFSAGGVVTQQHIADWHETSQAVSGQFGNPAVAQGLQAAAKNNGQSYSLGQCTYYAARSLGFIPGGLGNASEWAHHAAEKGMNVTHTPAVGTAVVYGAGGNYSPQYGHVAVVTAVNPDGSFQVSEMNVDGVGVADTRTSTMADVIGFINAPAGTDMRTAAPGIKAAVSQSAKPVAHDASPQQKITGLPDAPKPKGPPPAEVQKFAQHLQGAGIDPNDFAQNFPAFAASRRRLMQLNSNPGDYAAVVSELQARGEPVDQTTINAYINNLPHPTYPDLTVGQFQATHSMATLHSVTALGRTPHAGEVARLAGSGANWTQTKDFYGALATDVSGDRQPQASPQLSVVQGQQQQDKQPMPQQRAL